MRTKSVVAAALLAVSLTLTGCSAGGAQDTASSKAARPVEQQRDQGQGNDQASGAGGGAAVTSGAEGEDGKSATPAGTHVIRTAELSVRVKDAQQALVTARTAATDAGGLVEDEVTQSDPDGGVTSQVVLRVPQDSYDQVLSRLAGTGKLLSRKANAKDVTDQVVDVNSRIASQRVSVARVRELMDRATRLSDVVELEGELSSRQSALESLLAQQASLKDRTTLATITLHISENPVVVKAEKKKEEDPGFLDALGGGWDALVTTVRWIGVVLGAVLPFAAVFGALFVLWRLLRRFLPGAGAAQAPAPAGLPAEQAPEENRTDRTDQPVPAAGEGEADQGAAAGRSGPA
ncbi:DUF4349 domain-containing protein [Streptomyces sp. NPDC093085]|uniref:DUF4349 domain-containing protein n=1 Tax=Streptomyces sp. NPDC093085 TaxID=3155068 RepID=UPI00342EB954